MLISQWRCCAASFSFLLLTACAFDVYRVDLTPVPLEAPAASQSAFELQEQVDLDIGNGYRRTLKRNTIWTPVGSIPNGDVYKSRDQILTIEASNIYEAYIVVSGNEMVGFYLPVEDAYYPLEKKATLSKKTIAPTH